jgi:hypothetical protein
MIEQEVTRYSAYFRGWCQAFGEHENVKGEASGAEWLLADSQVGLVLPAEYIKPLYREVLLHDEAPPLVFCADKLRIGSLTLPLGGGRERQVLDAMAAILQSGEPLHLYLTSHLLYGSGARIITFSRKKPILIIYKEIGRMRVQLL